MVYKLQKSTYKMHRGLGILPKIKLNYQLKSVSLTFTDVYILMVVCIHCLSSQSPFDILRTLPYLIRCRTLSVQGVFTTT
ncbi:protein of unknown function [Streptococcus thermophilus]|uniref:Uncharacterized protein n=1 Tax=Streptococcus thermophilus TaxID=1308 RepID=A0A8D6XRW2_STRTR|nr:protein of unknown function [Streptococcus thermophilus]